MAAVRGAPLPPCWLPAAPQSCRTDAVMPPLTPTMPAASTAPSAATRPTQAASGLAQPCCEVAQLRMRMQTSMSRDLGAIVEGGRGCQPAVCTDAAGWEAVG
jgi:hypothetical protein